jgi:hypothetical protein
MTGLKTPNTKLQTPKKLQASSTKTRGLFLELGVWCLFGVWSLVFVFFQGLP